MSRETFVNIVESNSSLYTHHHHILCVQSAIDAISSEKCRATRQTHSINVSNNSNNKKCGIIACILFVCVRCIAAVNTSIHSYCYVWRCARIALFGPRMSVLLLFKCQRVREHHVHWTWVSHVLCIVCGRFEYIKYIWRNQWTRTDIQ